MTDAELEIVARELCLVDGYDPDAKEPGGYTLPYDAPSIGDDNWHCDGRGDGSGAGYQEPWFWCWRLYCLRAQAAITALDAHRAGGVGEGCCSVGLGGPYVIPPSGLEPGCKHPWHISWLPKGYAPTSDDFIICLVAEPPGEDWGKFGLTRGDRPPLVEAICAAIEGILRAPPPSTPDGGGG